MSAAEATEIPGWFRWVDQQLFRSILADQADGAPGDVVELGTYLGKSAVLIGEYVRPTERFVAVDLFGRTDLLGDHTDANRREVDKSRSEEHTSELQSRRDLVCRLLLEKKKN